MHYVAVIVIRFATCIPQKHLFDNALIYFATNLASEKTHLSYYFIIPQKIHSGPVSIGVNHIRCWEECNMFTFPPRKGGNLEKEANLLTYYTPGEDC